MYFKDREFYVAVHQTGPDAWIGELKSPYGQRTTAVLYTDIGTAKRSSGKGFRVAKVKVVEVEE